MLLEMNSRVDVIENEVWFNISGTPIGPIGQEIEAERNLTYEYTVPQTDWANRKQSATYMSRIMALQAGTNTRKTHR